MNITWIEQSIKITSEAHQRQVIRLLDNDKQIRNVAIDGSFVRYEQKYGAKDNG